MSGGVGASRAVLRKRRRKAKKDDNRAERRKAPLRQHVHVLGLDKVGERHEVLGTRVALASL